MYNFSASSASCDKVARICEYDKKKDIEKVRQGLAVYLPDALRNGKIPPIELPDTENGLTSPDYITGRLQDEFDAAAALASSRARSETHKANKVAKAAAAAAAAAAPPSA